MLFSHEIKSQHFVQLGPKTGPQLTKLLDIMTQKIQTGDYSFNIAYGF